MAEIERIPRHLAAVSGAGFHAKWRIPTTRLLMTTPKAILASMQLPRDVYIHAAERVAYAMSLAQDLSLRTSLWWAQDPVTVLARSGSRSSDIDVVALTDPLPPLNDWWRRAVDVFSNIRSAFDQFHHEVWLNQVGSEPGRSIYFPITANEPSWDKWAKEHRWATRSRARRRNSGGWAAGISRTPSETIIASTQVSGKPGQAPCRLC